MLASCVIPERRKMRISLLWFNVCIIVLIFLHENHILFTPCHVASSVVYLVLSYFPELHIKWHNFRENTFYTYCVSWPSLWHFSKTFLTLWIIQGVVAINVLTFSCKVFDIFYSILPYFNFLTACNKISQKKNHAKPSGATPVVSFPLGDINDEASSRFSQLSEGA